MQYRYKTEPFPYQRTEFEDTRDFLAWALYWEQGTGKSKVSIDNVAWLMQTGKVNCCIVIAPEGVHSNWTESYKSVLSQWETHCPDDVFKQTDVFTFDSNRCGTKKWDRSANKFLSAPQLKLLSITYDGLMTLKGAKLVLWLLKNRNCIVIVDEAHKIKTPDITRTVAVWGVGVLAKYKRILTGTFISQSPFDAYAPIKFLDPDYWDSLNLGKFWAFKRYFANWKKAKNWKNKKPHGNTAGVGEKPNWVRINKSNMRKFKPWQISLQPTEFNQLVDYKNKEELQYHISKFGSRILKADVLKHLPKMTHETLLVPLSKEQRKHYKALEEDYETYIDGVEIETTEVMTRLGKMHQVIQGFLKDEFGECHRITKNPRMDMLMDICETTDQPVLIWATFVSDIEEIEKQLKVRGLSVVTYYGGTSKQDRLSNKEAFQSGKVQFFVSHPRVGGAGIDLTATGIMIYYGHTYSVIERLQSEERVARPNLDHPWLKIDMLSRDTFEYKILEALATNQALGTYLMKQSVKRME